MVTLVAAGRWHFGLWQLSSSLCSLVCPLSFGLGRRSEQRSFLLVSCLHIAFKRVSWTLLFVCIKLSFLGIWSLLRIVLLWLGVLDYILKNFEIKMSTAFFITEGTIIRPLAIYSLHFQLQQSAKSTLTTRTLTLSTKAYIQSGLPVPYKLLWNHIVN